MAEGKIGEADLVAAQDAAIVELITHQERIGFPVIVDGEFRRAAFMGSFAEVPGFENLPDR